MRLAELVFLALPAADEAGLTCWYLVPEHMPRHLRKVRDGRHHGKVREILAQLCKMSTFVPGPIPSILQPKKESAVKNYCLFRVFIGVLGSKGFLSSV